MNVHVCPHVRHTYELLQALNMKQQPEKTSIFSGVSAQRVIFTSVIVDVAIIRYQVSAILFNLGNQYYTCIYIHVVISRV